MKIKIDTKEKLTVLHLPEGVFSENMAEELAATAAKRLQQPIKNMVINFAEITQAAPAALLALANIHQKAAENNASLVLCHLNASIKKMLDALDLSDVLNITPTESEALDMVHMEEIEREMFG